MEHADIYYFSGTGNTLLACREIAATLRERGVEAKLHPIERSDPAAVDPGHTLGIGFPTAAAVTYPIVLDFLHRLPPGGGAGAFAITTLGGGSLGILDHTRGILAEKGYTPLGAKEIHMPFNTLIRRYDPEKTRRQVEKGLESTRRLAVDLAEGDARWGRIPIIPDLAARALANRRAWNFFGRLTPVHRDEKKCTGCRLCERICPARAMRADVRPENLEGCQLCLRCVSYCPAEALHYARDLFARYRAVDATEFLTQP
ncbi:MAG: EFR1 family ferrodoxin [Candidatus Bathyarchaeota archaeon]|nr:EFR1 family ferrodoxin [Candidatus Bathyarchaeota archaeon]